MEPAEKMMYRANALLKERGENSLKLAKQAISQEKTAYEPLGEALNYFMSEVWRDFMHPGLMSLACETVGGKPEETLHVGAAFVLLAGAADIHDDIIDQSTIKGSKLTVLGKFGKDIAILAGDALLFRGLYMLHDAVRKLQDDKRNQILESVRQAFLGISSAEAKEASCKGNEDLAWQEYFGIIKMKAAVAKATTRIGAILGNATAEEIEILSDFGETLGILSSVRDECIDVFEADELRNRAENECLPLPVLLAFQDPEKKRTILQLIQQPTTDESKEKILELTMDSNETLKFMAEMRDLMEQEIERVSNFQNCKLELILLLRSSLEDI